MFVSTKGTARGGALVPMLLQLCLLAACTDRDVVDDTADVATAVEVVDDAGRTVTLARPARRIISLVPAQTEILLALGVRDRLIARTAYDEQPELAGLPAVGNALTPNIEWLAAQRPDLVIAWRDTQSRAVVDRLAEFGIAAYSAELQTIPDIERSIERLGVLTGRAAAADSIRRTMRAALTEVRDAVAGRPLTRVLYLIGVDPPMAAGPGSFVDESIALAGGDNVLADASGEWPLVSLEEIVRRDPDVIVLGTQTSRTDADALVARLQTLPGWRDLTALRTGNVHWADPSEFNRPSPRIATATRSLAAMLHPELPWAR